MDAKKCDRCGDFFNTSDKEIYIINYRYKDKSGNLTIYDNKLDFCPKCSEDFNKFMNKEIIKNENNTRKLF